MKKASLFLTATAFLFFNMLFAQTKQTRLVSNFDGISSATGIDVAITQGEDNTVVVSCSKDELIENLKTEVDKNGVLKIYYKNGEKNWNGNKNLKLNAYVTFKNINKLTASSGSSLHSINTVNANDLTIDVSSGASFSGGIKSKECNVSASSGASVKLNGTAENATIDASSGADIKAAELNTESCKANASSGADIKIAVSKKLSASASSGADIKYKGNPEVTKKSEGSGGSIRKM